MIIKSKEELQQFENKFVVYMLTSPSNKKYCGYSSNIIRRWKDSYEYRNNTAIYNAIQKYGWENIQKEILFVFDNAKDALLKEKEIIEEYDLLNKEKGYNLVPGGGDPPHGKQFITPEGLKKMEENGHRLAKEVWGNPEKAAYAIQRMKEETHKARMKMTEEQRKESFGKHNLGQTPPNAKSIYQLDKNTLEIIAEYPSSNHASLEITGSKEGSSNIRAVARGKKNSAYGYKWRWKEE